MVAPAKTLQSILVELKKIQDEHVGKAMPTDVGQKFDALAAEAEQMQAETDRAKVIGRVEAFEEKSHEVASPILPKANIGAGADDEVVAYFTAGQAFTRSPEYQAMKASGSLPDGMIVPVRLNDVAMLRGLKNAPAGRVPITRKAYREIIERKAIPTIGAGVIAADRDSDVVRAFLAGFDTLTIRDLVNVSQTSSNVVEFVRIDSHTLASVPVAEGAAKPQSTMAISRVTAPVRTIAVWMPVTEQQLMDVPQLENIIDEELRYDLSKTEEVEMVWGPGTGEHLLGIMKTPGVTATRTVGGDTLIDKIKRAITDVHVNGKTQPTAVAIHPYDWETVVLAKGTDNRYVWVVVSDGPLMRIWGVPVLETVAVTDSLSAATTKQRVCIVADWKRGATLWDRLAPQVQIGWQNDDFVKNLRTIRGEERVAFAAKRPSSFSYIETVASVP